ncbi:MAG: adenylate/guanylate cyclase domain-containing protein [Alphaproteobacteria bacterium]
MTSDERTREDTAAQVATLSRQVRVLDRKLTRSEESRVRLEEAKDRFDALHRNLIGELDEQKELLDEKNRMLESLSSKLSKYLAPQIYQSIFSGRQDVSLETKRKKLTVFFSDIKDFTQITEDLQAEDLASLLNEYFTEMSKIALEHGATIDKFIGDAMLMFFGDPETKGVEQDAKACVHMAIAMQRRMRDLQADWHDKGYEQPFRMRIGINTGFCNVGNFGSSDRMDYTIIGGEVNLAARLERQADPDGILLSFETYALVRDIVDAEERPSIQAKGIRREIRPFALGNFLDQSGEDRFIRCNRDGVSIRIDLERLSDENRRDTLEQLAEIMERLRR